MAIRSRSGLAYHKARLKFIPPSRPRKPLAHRLPPGLLRLRLPPSGKAKGRPRADLQPGWADPGGGLAGQALERRWLRLGAAVARGGAWRAPGVEENGRRWSQLGGPFLRQWEPPPENLRVSRLHGTRPDPGGGRSRSGI